MRLFVAEVPAAPALGFAVIAMGACFSFVFLWTFDKAFRTLFAPLMTRVAEIGIGGTRITPGVHPFRFLQTVVEDVERWTRSGMAGSERAISYGFGAALWAFYDLCFTVAKLGYDFNTALDNVWARVTRDAVPVKTAVSKAQIRKLQAQEAILNERLGRLEHAKQGAVGAAKPQDLRLLQRGIDRLNARVNTITRELHGTAQADVHTGEHAHPAVLGIPHWVARRLSKLEKRTVGVGAAALVATGLGRLGLSFLRCPGISRIGKKFGCGIGRFLESLLGLAIDALVITNLCTITKLLTDLGVAVQPLVVKLTTGVAKLMECQGAGALPNLTLAPFELPAVEGDGLPL